MDEIINQLEKSPKFEKDKIIASLYQQLPQLAGDIVGKSLDLSNPDNKKFHENPDDPGQHEYNWHQWGVITHTEKFSEYFNTESKEMIRGWGLEEFVEKYLSEKIGDMTKKDLLEISIPLHDIGKFAVRTVKYNPDGSPDFSFKTHEKASGRIIREPEFIEKLKAFGLSDDQIEVIAHYAEKHFELGILRNAAKKSETGFTMKFVDSEAFDQAIGEVINSNPDIPVEIGLMYLSDSLVKASFRVEASTDEEIANKKEEVKKQIAEAGLYPKLVNCVLQMPINISVAKKYLEECKRLKEKND